MTDQSEYGRASLQVAAQRLRPAKQASDHSTKLGHSLFAGKAADSLRESIIEGELAGGSPLVEAQLSEQLQVSRGPVRNALQALEAEGLVKTLPNGRMVVVGFGPEDLHDLLATRLLLESSGVRLGLERGADQAPVREAFEAIERVDPSNELLVALDIAFHRSLVSLSGSRFLVNSWLSLAPVLQSVIAVSSRRLARIDPADHQRRIVDSHKAIVDAVEARDLDAAVGMLRDQFGLTGSMFTTTQSNWKGA
jgi:DNA-binding GntR family transcriptional regulator